MPGKTTLKLLVPFAFNVQPKVMFYGLVDSGAVGTRMDIDIAHKLGIDLSDATKHTVIVAAGHHTAYETRVRLHLGPHAWDARVSFIAGWSYGHQLLGIQGFFDSWIVKIDASSGYVRVSPSRKANRP